MTPRDAEARPPDHGATGRDDGTEPADPAGGAGAAEGTDALQARIAELEDLWRRALADLDNVRKRMAREAASLQAGERARVASEWLPVIDNLDLALQHAESDPVSIVKGVEAVRDQAQSVLANLGYPRREDDVGTR
ncbi:MAG: molecular chaperone GrpE, partial [Cryptosporangiaceae bacterium]|nr:molecular chaperone GrpE [Cryptosporangiaceae bacterium]